MFSKSARLTGTQERRNAASVARKGHKQVQLMCCKLRPPFEQPRESGESEQGVPLDPLRADDAEASGPSISLVILFLDFLMETNLIIIRPEA